MKQESKRLIAIGAVASAIGTVGAAIAIKGFGFLSKAILSLLTGTWHVLVTPIQVPVWLVIPGVGWIFITLYLMLKAASRQALGPRPQTHYFQDNFFGLTWRWNYLGGSITPPRCFCPSCGRLEKVVDQQLAARQLNFKLKQHREK